MARRPSVTIPTTIQGKVTDLNTKAPIPEAEVVLFDSSRKIIAFTLTNSQGEYRIKASIHSGYYFLKASKEGYVSQGTIRFLQQGKTYTVNFSLKRIPNLPPKILKVIPHDNSTFLVGASVKIRVYTLDPEKGPLEYQFLIGGAIKQSWSPAHTYIWQTSAADTGTVSITCQVRDNKGAVASRTITCYIINPTVEEILQKVADNYALVNDKQMDVTVTSKFNNETFGSTIYTRHYFEKPDKQRTDTFSRPDRADSSKTEIHIALGPDIYLIDPISHAQSQRNILSELNLTQEQLNQMDEIYHLEDFFNAHTISRIDTPQDLAKGLVMLEAIPKTPNGVYSKLGLQIDYFKGLKTKSQTFFYEDNQDKLKQTIEITTSRKMPNGAWVPIKQVKTLYLTDGDLIMTSKFKNIQINTGLSDYLFDPTKQ